MRQLIELFNRTIAPVFMSAFSTGSRVDRCSGDSKCVYSIAYMYTWT